jgi:hypothetical protein
MQPVFTQKDPQLIDLIRLFSCGNQQEERIIQADERPSTPFF